MELFNIYNSYIMRPLPFVINALFTKKEIRKTELKKLISNVVDTKSEKDVLSVLVDDKYIKNVYLDTDNNCSDNIFNWENNCLVADNIVKSPLPIVFSKQEKEYIRLMLEDKEARCFMSEELIEKLRDEFDKLGGYDVSHITDNYIEREAMKSEIDETEMRKFVLVIAEALRLGKKIKYAYASKDDGMYEGIGSPYRFLYSLRERELKLALQPEGKKRFVKMALNRFISIELTDIDVDFNPEEDFYKKQRRRLIIEVDNDKRNDENPQKDNNETKAVERCTRIFSSYKRHTVYDKEKDIVRIALDFYRFDEQAIIDDIISLGSKVKVIEVQRLDERSGKYVTDTKSTLRDNVIKKLLQMYNNMP